MTPTTPDQGFAQAIADIGNIFCGIISECNALTKERDALAAAAKLAIDALDEAQKYAYNVGKYLHGVPQAIAAFKKAGVQ